MTKRPLLATTILLAVALPASGQLPCNPCVGLATDDPESVAEILGALPKLPEEALLVVKWPVDLVDEAGVEAAAGAASRLRDSGAMPWYAVRFAAPPPAADRAGELTPELERLANLARTAQAGAFFQLIWPTELRNEPLQAQEYALALKRAAVAVSGAQPDAVVVSAPLPGDPELLRALYAQELDAYLDGVALTAPATSDAVDLSDLRGLIRELDPDALVAVEPGPAGAAATGPDAGGRLLVRAAAEAEAGATLSLFPLSGDGDADIAAVRVARLIAQEFSGDVAFDPYSTPAGAAAWSFVHGQDLSLRIVVAPPAAGAPVTLSFNDRQIGSPARFDPATGETDLLFGGRRTRNGYVLELTETDGPFLFRLDRDLAVGLDGAESIEEALTVADTRQVPVGEILRRLQAFEDDQSRRIANYSATNTTSLRFQLGTGIQTIDVTFQGPFFFRQESSRGVCAALTHGKRPVSCKAGFDWAWDNFFVNGIRWRRKKIPEIPLIQPEKAAAMPAAITFTKEYRYRLRGAATVEGRDTWVVEFEPAAALVEGRTLFRGTVWVDREIYARVKTRAVQLGLTGDVLSNDETTFYTPVDANGEAAAWERSSYWLPARVVSQRLFSLLNATTVVEGLTELTGIEINPADFETRRQAALASEATMVRDTDVGLRYLAMDNETGERVVKEDDKTRMFIVGGAFYDEAQSGPLPLAGVNWLAFDWRGTGAQADLFIAGPLILANVANPSLFGSRWDAGADLFALAFAGEDTLYRDGRESPRENVKRLRPNMDFSLGRPLGSYTKLDFRYELSWNNFQRADATSEDFVLPADHLSHSLGTTLRYTRSGYRLVLGGAWNLRGEWAPWGLDGANVTPDSYTLWNVGAAKTWHLPKFQKIGLSFEYADGADLDRFSKYEFGFFSDITVHGYQSDKVRAERAAAAHLSYGFELGQLFRIDLVGDAAWATDMASGLDNELLAGAGIVGTFIGPWGTLVNMDVGTALVGPDDGWSAFIAVLKLF